MKMMSKVAALLAVLTLLAAPALALDKFEADLKVEESTTAIKKFMTADDADAARFLLRRAEAVCIMPGLVKAGFVVGGKYGHGVLLKRAGDRWSPPAFFTMVGASFGFQIGAESTDLFMLIMNDHGLNGVLEHGAKIGADASVAVGPVGRSAEASLSDANLKADIYSYSRSAGAFAGATVEGSGMEYDAETTKAYYGKAVSAQDVLAGKVTAPESAKKLDQALADLAK